MSEQQGEVLFFQTPNGGEIVSASGLIEMTGGLESAAYLSLFGGSQEDDGRPDNAKTWWGNIGETEVAKQYRSETQNLISSLPMTSGNLSRIEKAAGRDLAWMVPRAASEVTVFAQIEGVKSLKLTVDITAEGEESRFEFVENWKSYQ